MGLVFRKRKRLGRRTKLNVSKSGASMSWKLGPITDQAAAAGDRTTRQGLVLEDPPNGMAAGPQPRVDGR